MNYHEDIIAAVATPGGVGAISVIRVSGPGSLQAVDAVFSGKVKIIEAASHTIHYGKILDDTSEPIDDVLVSVFHGPSSYTGEDSVEISTHGNPLISKNILACLINKGVRLAEPGEFTKRAFLNGRIDLTQAEAVADIIASRTETSLSGARNQLNGLLSQKVETLRSMLIQISSLLELELDFSQDDLEFVKPQELIKKIGLVIEEINQLIDSYSFGKIMRDGIHVAIVGETNVGKSSLLNYFLKENRAIVSDMPGTTRDVIREDLSYEGILFHLFDTAGIRETEHEVEKEGVSRSHETVRNADLVLFINDIQKGVSKELSSRLLELTQKDRIITVMNKIDLGLPVSDPCDIKLSAITGEGINDLLCELKRRTDEGKTYTEKTTVVTNLRHYTILEKARESLSRAILSLQDGLSSEFTASDVREAVDDLGEIIGIVTTDDILNNIFSKFCIGK